MKKNIMQYESSIWNTADLLLGAGIKQSDFPKNMMPFFALIMIESRLIRLKEEIIEELGSTIKDIGKEDFVNYIKDQGKGYNSYLFEENKTLADICKNDKSFGIDFHAYMNGFDSETKDLLGFEKGNDEEKFLDISGVIGQLKKKRIFFSYVKEWSGIDLKPYNNSEITTLEEHIKRKWADFSADTAGEQYTPDDVIALISDVVISKISKSERFLTIYDPTVGGGNLLFGIEDEIKKNVERPTATYGQDWNDSLYALAKIESRFRENSHIAYGNTLTSTKFNDILFDVVSANPPYGVDWKGYRKDIENDRTGRFHALPSVSDGQLLFTQHIVSKIAEDGIGVVVHNGSTIFSGDAGSGENEIRKMLFDNDFVEAIIQLPTDEFFNTNIFTYIWIFNKSKPANRKDKVMLINAVEKFELLKKNKGKKRKYLTEEYRKEIVDTLKNYEDNEFSKVYEKEEFYYNKQSVLIKNLDKNGKSIEDILPVKVNKKTGEAKRAASIKLNDLKEIQGTNITIEEFTISSYDQNDYKSLREYYEDVKKVIKTLDYKNGVRFLTENHIYYYNPTKETIIKENIDGKKEELGCGKRIIKSSYKKATKSKDPFIEISVEITPDYEKDYEIIPYKKDPVENQENIGFFTKKFIKNPFTLLENVVGVEVNFNKSFYKPQSLRRVTDIVSDIKSIEKKVADLEAKLQL